MKMYKCKLCSYETGSRTQMRKHAQEYHGLKGLSKVEKRNNIDSRVSDSYKAIDRSD